MQATEVACICTKVYVALTSGRTQELPPQNARANLTFNRVKRAIYIASASSVLAEYGSSCGLIARILGRLDIELTILVPFISSACEIQVFVHDFPLTVRAPTNTFCGELSLAVICSVFAVAERDFHRVEFGTGQHIAGMTGRERVNSHRAQQIPRRVGAVVVVARETSGAGVEEFAAGAPRPILGFPRAGRSPHTNRANESSAGCTRHIGPCRPPRTRSSRE